MYVSRKKNSRAFVAVLVVALFAVCAFIPAVEADTGKDSTSDGKYSLVLFTNESFTYNPVVNLTDGDTRFSLGDGTSNQFEIKNNNSTNNSSATLTSKKDLVSSSNGTSNAGETVIINANWTSADEGNAIHQDAKQTITFYIYKEVEIANAKDATDSLSIPTSNSAGALVRAYAVTSYDTAAVPAFEAEMTGTEESKNIIDNKEGAFYVTASATDGIKIFAGKEKITEGDYTIKVTGTETGKGTDAQTRYCVSTLTVTITVAADLAFDEPTKDLYTYVGSEDYTFNTKTNAGEASATDADSLKYTISSFTDRDGKTYSSTEAATQAAARNLTLSGSTLTFASSNYSVAGTNSDTLKVTLTATANRSSDTGTSQTSTVEKNIMIKIYRTLTFTTKPVISDPKAATATGNPLDMLLTTNISGANRIVYTWGDGKTTSVDVSDSQGTSFAARHVYSSAGTYLITVTASNDRYSSSSVIMYDADDSMTPADNKDVKDDNSGSDGFIGEHGWLFIVFAVLAILFAVAYVYFGVQTPYVLVLLALSAILAVVLFVFKDFGGIADALSGLLGKD